MLSVPKSQMVNLAAHLQEDFISSFYTPSLHSHLNWSIFAFSKQSILSDTASLYQELLKSYDQLPKQIYKMFHSINKFKQFPPHSEHTFYFSPLFIKFTMETNCLFLIFDHYISDHWCWLTIFQICNVLRAIQATHVWHKYNHK